MVLVIPGLNGTPELLKAAAPKLLPGLRVIVFDHRLDEAEGGLDGLADRALAALDGHSEDPVFVLGESFGGPIALTIARRYPPRVRGLLLFSTFAHHPLADRPEIATVLNLWEQYGLEMPDGPATAAVRRLAMPAQLGLDCPPDLVQAYLEQPPAHLSAFRAKCQLALEFDSRPWLARITCPAFVLAGTRDPVVPPSAGRELAGRLARAHFHLVRGGHLVHIVQAARVGRLVRSWVQAVGRVSDYADPAHLSF